MYCYPALLRNPAHPNAVTGMIVASGVLADGEKNPFASDASFVNVYAPARGIKLPAPTWPGLYDEGSGTSFAAPTVAGLALYLRSLEPGLTTAASVKSRILELAYVCEAPQGKNPANFVQHMIWSGQLISGGNVCGSGGPAKRQVTGPGFSCAVNIPPPPAAVSFNRGAPSPTCASGGCGQFCLSRLLLRGQPHFDQPGFPEPAEPRQCPEPCLPQLWAVGRARSPRPD
jgi:hypothetical protein